MNARLATRETIRFLVFSALFLVIVFGPSLIGGAP